MDGDGGLGGREWGYYQQPFKSNMGLQLKPNVGVEQDTKNLLSSGAFLHREYGLPQSSLPMEYARDGWMSNREKFAQMLPPMSYPGYGMHPDASGTHHLQLSQQLSNPPKNGKLPQVGEEEPGVGKDDLPKKRPQCRPRKAPTPKKPKKAPSQRDGGGGNGSAPRGRTATKSTSIVINGIDLDLSGMPTPVCSCTGTPQQCYRWGVGGWQSACCTTTLSEYPLPMSTKRRGARIPGRKMSLGAFKKVLEKLAGEGYNLSNPIDLRTYWAKHGTNKFVTIR